MDGKERGQKPRKEATEEKAESCQVVIVRNTIGVGLRPHLKLLNFFKTYPIHLYVPRSAFYCMNEQELVEAAVSYVTNGSCDELTLVTHQQVVLLLFSDL